MGCHQSYQCTAFARLRSCQRLVHRGRRMWDDLGFHEPINSAAVGDVAHGNGKFIASCGAFLWSNDGLQWHKRLIESFPELLSRAPDPRYFGLRRQSAAATAFWIASRALWSRPPHTYLSCKNNFRVFRIVPQRDRALAQNPKSKTRNPKQSRRTEIRIAKPDRRAPF